MKAPFRVVTDSTADVPREWVDRYGIRVVPLKVLFGNTAFRDRVDLDDHEFLRRLEATQTLPSTSAPAAGEFADLYRVLAQECEAVISIHIGSELSGTVDAARLGAELVPEVRVEVIDSHSVSMAVGFLCQVAASASSTEEAMRLVQERIPKLRIIALLDTLRFLEMGGRIGRARAMLGALLNLKPILGVREGTVGPLDRVRTRSRGLERILELLQEDEPVERVAVMHARAPEEAQRLAAAVARAFPGAEVVTGQLGAVLTTHTGPGAIGFAYVKG